MDDALFPVPCLRTANPEIIMKLFYLPVFFACYATASQAVDLENGDDLHFENCTGCHDSTAYTRGTQVRFCKDNLGLAWFDDEVNDVIGYLNKEYYRF
jgi:cytochrome c2